MNVFHELQADEPHPVLVRVGRNVADYAALRAFVRDSRAGAVVTFEGVTREVEELQYEAYAQMAAEQMLEIALRAIQQHGACRAAIEHVVGNVPLGEPSVYIVVSAPHRGEAFSAARVILDELKQLAPIWKIEREGDVTKRVAGHVPHPT